jgi:hypothetical protein
LRGAVEHFYQLGDRQGLLQHEVIFRRRRMFGEDRDEPAEAVRAQPVHMAVNGVDVDDDQLRVVAAVHSPRG